MITEELERAPENAVALETALLERAYTVILNTTNLSSRGVKKLLDAQFARQARFHESWIASRAAKTGERYLRALGDMDRKFALLHFTCKIEEASKGLPDFTKEMKAIDRAIAKVLPQGERSCGLLTAFLFDRAFRLEMSMYPTMPKDIYGGTVVVTMERIWEEMEPLRADAETKDAVS